MLSLGSEGLAALVDRAELLGLSAVLVLALFLLDRRLARARRQALVHGAFLVATLAAGLWLARDVAWLCDDAFISFRYAANMARGEGLVFNPGEWVEGYTNFLWTAGLGVLGYLGADIPLAGLVGNLVAFVVALVAVAATVRRASPGHAVVPFAASALALGRPFHTYATSGLETMPAAALVALALFTSTTRKAPALTGTLLTLAALTRPDHVLLVGAMGLALVLEDLVHDRRLDLRRYAEYSAPFVLVFVPYFLVRAHVYGDWFPNTYYAKSGGRAYYEQGGKYLLEFVFTSGGWAFLPALLFVAFLGKRSRDDTRLRAFAVLSTLLLGGYVVRVGGDFMEHRFFVSLLPGIAVALEVAVRTRAGGFAWRRAPRVALVALAFAAAVVPIRLIGPGEKRWHIAEEATFYRVTSLAPLTVASPFFRQAEALRSVFVERGLRPRVAEGCVGMLAYYSDLPVFDMYGLTSRRVAHRRITERGRPGHEKVASLEDVLADGADLSFGPLWPGRDAETLLRVPGANLYLARWNPELLGALGGVDGVELPPIEQHLAHARTASNRSGALDDLAFFTTFLERHPDREALLAPLRRRLASIAELECALPAGGRLEGGFTFAEGAPRPSGASGRCWLTSGAPLATGRAELPLGVLRHPTLRFALGGPASTALRVELRVGGQAVATVSPSGEAGLVPFVIDVTEHLGEEAQLAVVDTDPRAALALDGVHGGDDPDEELAAALSGTPVEIAQSLRWLRGELPSARLEAPLAARGIAHLDFDGVGFAPDARVKGEAFGDAPVAGALEAQRAIEGAAGEGYVNSFHGGDASTGRLVVPLPGFRGGALSLLVGGGYACDATFVEVRAGHRGFGRKCGKGDEVLRPITLPVPKIRSRDPFRLVIEDRGAGAWQHILVDDVFVIPDEGPHPSEPGTGAAVN